MILDCRDMDCPRPVLETKKALDALPADAVLNVEVNTLSGRENCKRFALSQKCTYTEEPLSDGATRLIIVKGMGYQERPREENPLDAMMQQERRGAVLVLTGALVTALLSASCCLVPTLFMVFGISFAGIINVAALEGYRWIFTAIAVMMLSIGFYQMVIKKQIECDCEPSLTSKILVVLFWILFLISLAALSYPYYEGWIWGE
ncbi:MAG: mercuric transporter MerT family protein [Sulfuricurvum sp.]|jgi:TusA-related sulfurtransferase|uniref:mercuric transporter MerT family protein n=1 Tax=Sulfuricurvum sp. TaxID=2025608 RepID=UPI0025F894EB|nr:mercuric transporter MerT family protein [Sulfuricurvum sp.]MCK9372989.1 mercuric transporter MerT family protein [Sulfuricurvum sp.]